MSAPVCEKHGTENEQDDGAFFCLDCDTESGSCFTCGAGPGSADLHTITYDEEHTKTTCFRPVCQEHALQELRLEAAAAEFADQSPIIVAARVLVQRMRPERDRFPTLILEAWDVLREQLELSGPSHSVGDHESGDKA